MASSSSLDPSLGLIDHFDRLPDPLLLLVFHSIADIKALGRCCVVSRRFQTLVAQVDHVLVRVDCVISDDDDDAPASAAAAAAAVANPIAALFRFFLSCIATPIPAFSHFLGVFDGGDAVQDGVTHHSPTHVLRNFKAIRSLRIELPGGELGVDDGVLLKWRADFGSTLESCVILGASSLTPPPKEPLSGGDGVEESESIPESFYSNGGLKVRVAWTISSLIAASSRHYLLQAITAEHAALERLVLADSDGQGVLRMNREQLEELRAKPLSASSSSKRTLVPALSMRLWYAPRLQLTNGMVLKGATLVAIRPRQPPAAERKEVSDLSAAFEEPYGAAAKMLVKRRTYCLEMNSF